MGSLLDLGLASCERRAWFELIFIWPINWLHFFKRNLVCKINILEGSAQVFRVLARVGDLAPRDSLAMSLLLNSLRTAEMFASFGQQVHRRLSVDVCLERTALSLFLVAKCLSDCLVRLLVFVPVGHRLAHLFVFTRHRVVHHWHA